jgi:Na+/H+-translocating membrane pyrophosphatase
LRKEYTYLVIFVILFAVVLLCAVDQPWREDNTFGPFPYTTFAFLIGAFTSMIAGYTGMMIATTANVKVTYLCGSSIDAGFMAAFNGGQVLGFILVGLALSILNILILAYRPGIITFLGPTGTKTVLAN